MNQNEIVQWKQKFIMGVPITIDQAKINYEKYHTLVARYVVVAPEYWEDDCWKASIKRTPRFMKCCSCKTRN